MCSELYYALRFLDLKLRRPNLGHRNGDPNYNISTNKTLIQTLANLLSLLLKNKYKCALLSAQLPSVPPFH